MSYNIRYDNPDDSINAWPNRKEKVFALFKKYDADIVGLQEALHHQVTEVKEALRGYAFVGVGRDDGNQQGEYSAILYRKERFDLVDQNTFWLSENPETPGSKNWDAAITRVATWAVMMDKKTGRRLLIINTHFDHIGKEARKQSAEILKRRISELAPNIPVVLTGDFNCTRDDEPYQIITDGETIELIDPAPMVTGTFCGFKVNSIPCRAIDYIFLTNEWRADSYTVIDDNDGTYYPSDHLPVMITLSLTD
jgi:endonuclease/exonuclease/phosphatase family metal-dependent hydrolase